MGAGISCYAINCETVTDEDGKSMLARVSIVDDKEKTIYDKFVKPTRAVVDYRTKWTGMKRADVEYAIKFETVQNDVKNLVLNEGAVVIGHGSMDMALLDIKLSVRTIKDIRSYPKFWKHKHSSLKALAREYLMDSLGNTPHNSIEQAVTIMKLYLSQR